MDRTTEVLKFKTEIEQLFIKEAALLDGREYKSWLELFSDDLVYTMPLRRNVKYGEWEREFTDTDTDVTWFSDSKDTLSMRVDQILTGVHWAEEPSSRTVHLISNLAFERPTLEELFSTGVDPLLEVAVSSCFLTYRNRVQTETDLFAGRRYDTLKLVDDRWLISARRIEIAQNVLLAKNLTLFL